MKKATAIAANTAKRKLSKDMLAYYIIGPFILGLVIGFYQCIRDWIRNNNPSWFYEQNDETIKCDEWEELQVHPIASLPVLQQIDDMDGWQFERLVADMLHRLGYVDVTVTSGSNDQGADVIATKDDLKYAIQCKRYSSILNNKPIQEICAGRAFYNCDIGVVLTNNYFNENAKAVAKSAGILLWDRDKLIELLTKAYPDE